MPDSDREVTSTPSTVMLPPTTEPPPGSSRMTDSAVIVLPLPDSPTMPRHSPGFTVSDTPSMACTTPWRSRISVRRSSIDRSGANRKTPPNKEDKRRCSRTSNASRSASPMKLMAMTTRMIAMPAGKICHQYPS